MLRLLRALVARLLALLDRSVAQQAADNTATTRNKDAAHAAEAAQAAAPRDRAALADGVRRGDDF